MKRKGAGSGLFSEVNDSQSRKAYHVTTPPATCSSDDVVGGKAHVEQLSLCVHCSRCCGRFVSTSYHTMATSAVYYRFRSQREPQRLTFDGTGISVWELKREIILQNKMGKGTDFDLAVYNADTDEGT